MYLNTDMTYYGTKLESSKSGKRGKSFVSCLEAAWKQVRRESEGLEKVKGQKLEGKGHVILLMWSGVRPIWMNNRTPPLATVLA